MQFGAMSLTDATQEIPAEYSAMVMTLGKTSDFNDGVLRVNSRGTICA